MDMSAYADHLLLPPRAARSVASATTGSYGAAETTRAREVRRGLTLLPKSLPAHLSYDAAGSNIEMHLERVARQDVAIDLLDLRVRFRAGATIHTESSIKYDVPRVERIVKAGGFRVEETCYDRARRFALHWARATDGGR
jgi:uncharacterized SAM-dependent methyltransferase